MTMINIPGSINRVVPGLAPPTAQPKISSTDSEGFGEVFSNLLNSVNELQQESGALQQSFLAGDPVELHQVMIKAEEAGVAMDLLLEIRNKLVSAYSDIIRMPV